MLTQGDIKVIEEIVEDKTKLLPTKEEFFSKMDEVMGELKATREAIDLHTGQHDEITDQIDDHEKRIKIVEQKLHVPVVS
jgi:hypothetical protein